ncbi:MAG: hypothetical protein IT546_04255 [Caulobacteraceae bacterium]|nr:hypothetical protein [Caulobacteraceae bacterium]
MAQSETGGGNSATPWLAFLVGGLIVIVAVIGYFMYTGGQSPKPSVPETVNVDISAPKTPELPNAPAPAPSS